MTQLSLAFDPLPPVRGRMECCTWVDEMGVTRGRGWMGPDVDRPGQWRCCGCGRWWRMTERDRKREEKRIDW